MATTVPTRDEAVQLIRRAESRIRDLGVRRLALFGSVLRDEARPDSDVDLLVQFQPGQKTAGRFFALYDLLEELLPARVELVTTEALSPFIGPHILAEARMSFQPLDYLRHILVEVDVLLDQARSDLSPRPHGSALFRLGRVHLRRSVQLRFTQRAQRQR